MLRDLGLPVALRDSPVLPPAWPDIEDTIVNALNGNPVVQKEKSISGITRPDRKVILEQVARIDVHEDRLAIRLKHSRRRRNS